jgi:hypothetical protein
MNFKKPKQQVIEDASYAASNEISSAFSNIKSNYMYTNAGSVIDNMQYAISSGIRKAVESIVNNTYTDEEFEEDINLRDKQ